MTEVEPWTPPTSATSATSSALAAVTRNELQRPGT
jgi:hypothetical protein